MKRMLVIGVVLAIWLAVPSSVWSKAPENFGARAYVGITENEEGSDAMLLMGQLHYLLNVSRAQIGPFVSVGSWADETEGLIGGYGYVPVMKSLSVFGGLGLRFMNESGTELDFGIQYSLFRVLNNTLPSFLPRIPLPEADLQLGFNSDTWYIGLIGGSGSRSWGEEKPDS